MGASFRMIVFLLGSFSLGHSLLAQPNDGQSLQEKFLNFYLRYQLDSSFFYLEKLGEYYKKQGNWIFYTSYCQDYANFVTSNLIDYQAAVQKLQEGRAFALSKHPTAYKIPFVIELDLHLCNVFMKAYQIDSATFYLNRFEESWQDLDSNFYYGKGNTLFIRGALELKKGNISEARLKMEKGISLMALALDNLREITYTGNQYLLSMLINYLEHLTVIHLQNAEYEEAENYAREIEKYNARYEQIFKVPNQVNRQRVHSIRARMASQQNQHEVALLHWQKMLALHNLSGVEEINQGVALNGILSAYIKLGEADSVARYSREAERFWSKPYFSYSEGRWDYYIIKALQYGFTPPALVYLDSAEFFLQNNQSPFLKQSAPALRQNPTFAASIALLKGKYFAHHQQIALALSQFQKVLHLASEEVGLENLSENPSKNTFYRSHTLQLLSAQALLGKASLLARYPYPEWAALQAPEQIKQMCRRADDHLNDLRGKLVKENDRIALGETASQLYALSAKIALERQDAAEFFYFAERNKAQVLLQALQATQARNLAGLPDTLQKQESALRQAIFEAETALEQQEDSLKAEARSRLVEANRLYRAFREKVNQEYPKYFALQNESPLISLSEIQQKLAPGEALLSFTFLPNPEEIGSLFISRDEVQMTTLKEGTQILKNIRQLRSHLRGNPQEMAANIADKSYRLHTQLLAPWKAQLATIKRLLIIPESELNRLPFELLQANSPAFRDDAPQYLLNQVEITYHASATLAFSSKPEYATQGWLGMAPFGEENQAQIDIHEKETRTSGNKPKYLSPLYYSDDEIREIGRFCQQRNIPVAMYARDKAHKKQFLEKMADFRWIHLATHSWGNTQEGDFSGIAFYQPSQTKQEDENILYARELYHLSLKADLVVLSSCESGLGEDAPGEGVLSLTRSFLYAGAKHLLYTLQKVGDEAIYALMKAFYSQLIEKKLSYAEALRQAKLQMIRENRPPQDWAPVVLLGR